MQAIQDAVAEGSSRFLFEMATGTGKTLTAAAVIKLFLRTGNARRVLFLVDRLELEDQANKAFIAQLKNDYTSVIYKERRDEWRKAEIVVTTVQSLLFNDKYKRLFSPTDFDLVISDEAHRSIGGNARAVFEYFVGYKLGLTATPRDYLKKYDATKPSTRDPRETERRLLLDTYRTFGCESGQPTFRYSLLDGVRERSDRPFTSLVPSMPGSFRRIIEGETIEIGRRGDKHGWRPIFGYGHSPEHVALYDEGRHLLFSGDMVLPRISTNVSVFEMEPEANPVAWYMDSLRRYEDCAPDTLAFPAHGRPFRNVHRRVAQLIEHHEDRLAVVLEACRLRPMHAAETVPVMFQRTFDAQQSTFAIGETLAHLHALWYQGLVRRELGADGVIRFSATAAPR